MHSRLGHAILSQEIKDDSQRNFQDEPVKDNGSDALHRSTIPTISNTTRCKAQSSLILIMNMTKIIAMLLSWKSSLTRTSLGDPHPWSLLCPLKVSGSDCSMGEQCPMVVPCNIKGNSSSTQILHHIEDTVIGYYSCFTY